VNTSETETEMLSLLRTAKMLVLLPTSNCCLCGETFKGYDK